MNYLELKQILNMKICKDQLQKLLVRVTRLMFSLIAGILLEQLDNEIKTKYSGTLSCHEKKIKGPE
jgi:hypothetical protein